MSLNGAQLDEVVEALNRDALFTMPLGSKELFHSNLLAWFAEHYRMVAHPSPAPGRARTWAIGRHGGCSALLAPIAGQV